MNKNTKNTKNKEKPTLEQLRQERRELEEQQRRIFASMSSNFDKQTLQSIGAADLLSQFVSNVGVPSSPGLATDYPASTTDSSHVRSRETGRTSRKSMVSIIPTNSSIPPRVPMGANLGHSASLGRSMPSDLQSRCSSLSDSASSFMASAATSTLRQPLLRSCSSQVSFDNMN